MKTKNKLFALIFVGTIVAGTGFATSHIYSLPNLIIKNKVSNEEKAKSTNVEEKVSFFAPQIIQVGSKNPQILTYKTSASSNEKLLLKDIQISTSSNSNQVLNYSLNSNNLFTTHPKEQQDICIVSLNNESNSPLTSDFKSLRYGEKINLRVNYSIDGLNNFWYGASQAGLEIKGNFYFDTKYINDFVSAKTPVFTENCEYKETKIENFFYSTQETNGPEISYFAIAPEPSQKILEAQYEINHMNPYDKDVEDYFSREIFFRKNPSNSYGYDLIYSGPIKITGTLRIIFTIGSFIKNVNEQNNISYFNINNYGQKTLVLSDDKSAIDKDNFMNNYDGSKITIKPNQTINNVAKVFVNSEYYEDMEKEISGFLDYSFSGSDQNKTGNIVENKDSNLEVLFTKSNDSYPSEYPKSSWTMFDVGIHAPENITQPIFVDQKDSKKFKYHLHVRYAKEIFQNLMFDDDKNDNIIDPSKSVLYIEIDNNTKNIYQGFVINNSENKVYSNSPVLTYVNKNQDGSYETVRSNDKRTYNEYVVTDENDIALDGWKVHDGLQIETEKYLEGLNYGFESSEKKAFFSHLSSDYSKILHNENPWAKALEDLPLMIVCPEILMITGFLTGYAVYNEGKITPLSNKLAALDNEYNSLFRLSEKRGLLNMTTKNLNELAAQSENLQKSFDRVWKLIQSKDYEKATRAFASEMRGEYFEPKFKKYKVPSEISKEMESLTDWLKNWSSQSGAGKTVDIYKRELSSLSKFKNYKDFSLNDKNYLRELPKKIEARNKYDVKYKKRLENYVEKQYNSALSDIKRQYNVNYEIKEDLQKVIQQIETKNYVGKTGLVEYSARENRWQSYKAERSLERATAKTSLRNQLKAAMKGAALGLVIAIGMYIYESLTTDFRNELIFSENEGYGDTKNKIYPNYENRSLVISAPAGMGPDETKKIKIKVVANCDHRNDPISVKSPRRASLVHTSNVINFVNKTEKEDFETTVNKNENEWLVQGDNLKSLKVNINECDDIHPDTPIIAKLFSTSDEEINERGWSIKVNGTGLGEHLIDIKTPKTTNNVLVNVAIGYLDKKGDFIEKSRKQQNIINVFSSENTDVTISEKLSSHQINDLSSNEKDENSEVYKDLFEFQSAYKMNGTITYSIGSERGEEKGWIAKQNDEGKIDVYPPYWFTGGKDITLLVKQNDNLIWMSEQTSVVKNNSEFNFSCANHDYTNPNPTEYFVRNKWNKIASVSMKFYYNGKKIDILDDIENNLKISVRERDNTDPGETPTIKTGIVKESNFNRTSEDTFDINVFIPDEDYVYKFSNGFYYTSLVCDIQVKSGDEWIYLDTFSYTPIYFLIK